MSEKKSSTRKKKADSPKAVQEVLQPESVIAQPVPTAYEPHAKHLPKTAQLKNRHTGRVIAVSYTTAKGLSEKYPKEFEIIG